MNPEHLEIAWQEREAIDAWRRDNVGGQLDLIRANLSWATLSDANLFWTDLRGANLSDANLSATVLIFTVFSGNDLEGCQFKDARFSYTILADCDLSAALSLEDIDHGALSTIGLDTIVRSGGDIPESFLRGAGVPDAIITYVRSLVTEPLQFYT